MDRQRIEIVTPEEAKKAVASLLDPRGVFQLTHKSKHGEVLSIEEFKNLVTSEGKTYILDAAFNTTALTTVSVLWYFAIYTGAYTPAVGSTYASPGGTESTGYDETTRQAWDAGAATTTPTIQVSNASAATITATGSLVVTGIGVVGSPTEDGDADTPGDVAAADGILISEATVSKTLSAAETLDITYTLSC